MSSFKQGDLVECIDAATFSKIITIGNVYIVWKSKFDDFTGKDGVYILNNKSMMGWYFSKRFKKYEPS